MPATCPLKRLQVRLFYTLWVRGAGCVSPFVRGPEWITMINEANERRKYVTHTSIRPSVLVGRSSLGPQTVLSTSSHSTDGRQLLQHCKFQSKNGE